MAAFDTAGLPCRLGGEVDDAVLEPLIDRDAARRLSRISRLAVAAARLAVEEAHVDAGPTLGLVVGTEFGDFRSSGEFATGYLNRGPSGLSPMLFPGTVMNAMGAAVAIAIGVKGPTVTVNQPNVAGDLAVARGAALIARGLADAVLAGGVDELCGPVYRRLADELGVLSPMRGRRRPARGDGGQPARMRPSTTAPCSARARPSWCSRTTRSRERAAPPCSPRSWARAGAMCRSRPTPRRPSRPDARSALRGSLAAAGVPAGALTACWGAGSGDPALDDWELALLRADLPGRADLVPPRAIAGIFGQHAGVGAHPGGGGGARRRRGAHARAWPRPRRLSYRARARESGAPVMSWATT